MSKLVRVSMLLAFMLAVTAGAVSVADAQEKGKDKKPAEKAPEKAGKVEVYMAKDGYRFRIMDAEGKTIAQTTKAYQKKEDAIKALELVKTTLNTVKVTEVKEEKKEEKKVEKTEEKKP